MGKLIWAEYQKLRRCGILLFTVSAAVVAAGIVLIGGMSEDYGVRSTDGPGWYMTMVQPWATLFVLPAVIAMLGSYMICREEQDNTLKSLRILPVSEERLTAAKMLVTLSFSMLIYLLLFTITFLTEGALHFSDLSVNMVCRFLKMYLLEGIGVFLAVSPIIALVSYMKKSYWLALAAAEIVSFSGMFMSMSGTWRTFYPITAIFGVAGYYETTAGEWISSALVLLLCGCISIVVLCGLRNNR